MIPGRSPGRVVRPPPRDSVPSSLSHFASREPFLGAPPPETVMTCKSLRFLFASTADPLARLVPSPPLSHG